ncbi:copper resistance CopC family protein [Nakamurella lactea]|uniref:copper resistance CopC family protein n=1 Tax=Nakamurella lactea TaxID=459515 RepID=UPI000402B64F|nr:copper resistance CopC family protein [Nakamurella lactea]
MTMTQVLDPQPTSWWRRGLSAGAAVLLALLIGVGLALPASAHNTLTGSDPADGSTVSAAPTTVTLTFDQPVQNYQPVLTVTGPNGNRFSAGEATVQSNTVSVALDGAGPAGEYIAAYRVVSADGHPVSGEIRYTLAAGAAGTATGSPAPAGSTPSAAAGDGSSGLGVWLWIGIAVAALLVIAAVVVILRSVSGSKSEAGGTEADR